MADPAKEEDSEPQGENAPIACFRCGVCCVIYQPPVPPDEAQNIAENLGLNTQDFLARYAQLTPAGYLLRHSEKGCVFLAWEEGGRKATCTIHPFRPDACRQWTASLSQPECREGLASLKSGNSDLAGKP